MHVTGISYGAVVLAAIASFIFGGLWYGAFARRWLSAGGDSGIASTYRLTIVPFAITFVAQFVMAWMLAGILLHIGRGGITLSLGNALISAALIWIGFVMTSLAASHALQGSPFTRTLIDGGHWLGVLLIQGAILARMAS